MSNSVHPQSLRLHEPSYRRGFQQGVTEAIEAIFNGYLTCDDATRWQQQIARWQAEARPNPLTPPPIPRPSLRSYTVNV